LRLTIFLAACAVAYCFAPPSANGSTPALGAQLSSLYKVVGASFWRGENLLNAQTASRDERDALLVQPLPENNPAHREYSQCAHSADEFLKLADENKIWNWMLDPVLYFGGLAHFTLGNYARAQQLLSRLAPEYKRDIYINDRDPINPDLSIPTRPGVAKLLFYCRLKTFPKMPADALAALKQVTAEAGSTLQIQREYANFLANRKSLHARRAFDEKQFGGQPDQVRASALSSTPDLLASAWQTLLPPATKKNILATRDFLRGLIAEGGSSPRVPASPLPRVPASPLPRVPASPLPRISQVGSTPDAPLALLAAAQLPAIDALIVKTYFAQAQSLLKANNFQGARAKYKQIIAEYPDTPDARKAEGELPKIVPVEVQFYRAEGDSNFKPKTHVGIPQTKAREAYAKMLTADRDGPQADYALLHLGRAYGTEGKFREAIAQLRALGKAQPDSEQAPQAAFLIGFYLGAQKQYGAAITQLDKAATYYAKSPFAAESLWFAAYFSLLHHQPQKGLAFLERLQKYPDSPRFRHIPELAQLLREPATPTPAPTAEARP
jgi:tetratricopeptide (TPR) repeat protein